MSTDNVVARCLLSMSFYNVLRCDLPLVCQKLSLLACFFSISTVVISLYVSYHNYCSAIWHVFQHYLYIGYNHCNVFFAMTSSVSPGMGGLVYQCPSREFYHHIIIRASHITVPYRRLFRLASHHGIISIISDPRLFRSTKLSLYLETSVFTGCLNLIYQQGIIHRSHIAAYRGTDTSMSNCSMPAQCFLYNIISNISYHSLCRPAPDIMSYLKCIG